MDAHQGYRELATGRVGTAIAVYCRECSAQVVTCRADVPDVTPEEVAEQWNTRPTPTVEGGEIIQRLREGAGRVARHCMRAAEPGDPGLISIPRHERDIDAIMEKAAAALASRDAEIERLRGELRRAHLKRLVELSEEFGGYDELSTSALSALKTAREGNNA